MTNPIRPAERPIFCGQPVEEVITITNPNTGSQQQIRQLNLRDTPTQNIEHGITRVFNEKYPEGVAVLVQQYLNDQFRSIDERLKFLLDSINKPPVYPTAELPSAANNAGAMVRVSDIGNGTLAISNGANWIKLTMDGNV